MLLNEKLGCTVTVQRDKTRLSAHHLAPSSPSPSCRAQPQSFPALTPCCTHLSPYSAAVARGPGHAAAECLAWILEKEKGRTDTVPSLQALAQMGKWVPGANCRGVGSRERLCAAAWGLFAGGGCPHGCCTPTTHTQNHSAPEIS